MVEESSVAVVVVVVAEKEAEVDVPSSVTHSVDAACCPDGVVWGEKSAI